MGSVAVQQVVCYMQYFHLHFKMFKQKAAKIGFSESESHIRKYCVRQAFVFRAAERYHKL